MLTVMGINHATSGAAVWIATTAALPVAGLDLYHLHPAGVLSGALVCAGAALLPDADHKSATIAHSIPLVGELATDTVEHVSGGHRHAAHTLLAGAIVTAACVFIGRFTTHVPVFGEISLGPAIATVALVAFAVKARDFVRHWATAWLFGIIAAVLVLVYSPDSTTWFPVAVGIGFVTHIAGDMLTVEGVPSLIWPIQIKPPRALRRGPVAVFWHRNGYLSVPILGHAGSAREYVLGVLLGVYCVYGAGVVAMQAMHLSLVAS